MKNIDFDFKKAISIYTTEFKMKLKNTLIWSVAMFSIIMMYMVLFPSVKDMAMDKLAAMPAELLAAFGMSSLEDFSNFNTYFVSIYQIILIVLSGYAVVVSANIIHDEEATGSIEFLYSCNVSRMEIYVAKLTVIITNLIIIIIAIFLAAMFGGLSVAKDSVDVGAIFLTILLTSFVVLIFVGIGFFVSSLSKKNKKASNIALGVMFGTYIIGYFSNIGPDYLDFLKWFSPLDFLSGSAIMTSNLGIGTDNYNFVGFIISIILVIVFNIVGYVLYSKKDL
jgi:ABC-2 type transport system permease protein